MLEHDRSNFIEYLKQFPDQPACCRDTVGELTLDLDMARVQNVVLAGMGGSAISGDLLTGYARDQLRKPVYIHRDYGLPAFVDENTLFIASSYSGNTEETLAAVESAMKRKAQIIGISSGGGELERICASNDFPHAVVPGGFPPRQALGYMFFTLMFIMQKLELISVSEEDIGETIQVLNDQCHRYDPGHSFGNNLANHIAQSIYHAVPVIYSGAPFMQAIPVRWRNQFNENSKTVAFSNSFPELNHNEIVGWEALQGVTQHFRVIFLRDPEESARVEKRMTITKEILRGRNILFGEIFAEGNCRLARMFSLIYTGDWASYYLAMLNEQDPINIDSIDLLKNRLSGEVTA